MSLLPLGAQNIYQKTLHGGNHYLHVTAVSTESCHPCKLSSDSENLPCMIEAFWKTIKINKSDVYLINIAQADIYTTLGHAGQTILSVFRTSFSIYRSFASLVKIYWRKATINGLYISLRVGILWEMVDDIYYIFILIYIFIFYVTLMTV